MAKYREHQIARFEVRKCKRSLPFIGVGHPLPHPPPLGPTAPWGLVASLPRNIWPTHFQNRSAAAAYHPCKRKYRTHTMVPKYAGWNTLSKYVYTFCVDNCMNLKENSNFLSVIFCFGLTWHIMKIVGPWYNTRKLKSQHDRCIYSRTRRVADHNLLSIRYYLFLVCNSMVT